MVKFENSHVLIGEHSPIGKLIRKRKKMIDLRLLLETLIIMPRGAFLRITDSGRKALAAEPVPSKTPIRNFSCLRTRRFADVVSDSWLLQCHLIYVNCNGFASKLDR